MHHRRANNLRSKIVFLSCCVIGTFIIIIGRLFHLQIQLMDFFCTKSQKNFLRTEKVPPLRGNIVDCNNILLVTNRPVINIYWQGTGKKKIDKSELELLQKLDTILQTNLISDEKLLQELQSAERTYQHVALHTDLTFEQLSKVEEQFPHHKTILLVTNFERFYPYKSYASHILGYLSCINIEAIGSMGLEKLFEETLKGKPGSLLKIINSTGRNLNEIEQKKALAGNTIQTTLDIDIQALVEQIFPSQQAGSVIIMNPADGSILALLSRPNFDPTIFLHPIPAAEWLAMQEKRPFLNRAFNACYPPGSLFKLVSMSAMLEHNFITAEDYIYCKGYSKFYNGEYYCAKRSGHGRLSAIQALAESCNIPFFEIGKKIDINLLASYANHFGLGKKTNIIFAEKEGLIPTREWKLKVKKERWWQGETLSAIIGQSYVSVTPIQVACMISSIFTHYLVKPRILTNEEITKTPLPIKEPTLEFLKKSMRSVVTEGTGRKISRVKDIQIYAKTSTAQTSRYEKRALGTTYKEHGCVAAYFSYKENNPLTIVILVENIGTSREATIIAKDFLIAYKKLIDERENKRDLIPTTVS